MTDITNRLKRKPFWYIGIIGFILLIATGAGASIDIIPRTLISYLLITSTVLCCTPYIANAFGIK